MKSLQFVWRPMMTQSDYPIYTLDAIHEDICFLVSYFFYDTRKKKEYSLAEVSKKTGICPSFR